MERIYSKQDNWAFYNAAGPTVQIPRSSEVSTDKKLKVTNAGKWALYGAVAGAIMSMIFKKGMFKYALIGGGSGLVLGYLLGKDKVESIQPKSSPSTSPDPAHTKGPMSKDEVAGILASGLKLSQSQADKLRAQYDKLKEDMLTSPSVTPPWIKKRMQEIQARLVNAGYSVVSFDAGGTHNMGITKHWRNNTLS